MLEFVLKSYLLTGFVISFIVLYSLYARTNKLYLADTKLYAISFLFWPVFIYLLYGDYLNLLNENTALLINSALAQKQKTDKGDNTK